MNHFNTSSLDWSRIKGAIFDLDGTLADSMGVWKDIDRLFFEKREMTQPDDYSAAICSLSYVEAAEYTKKRFLLRESVEEIINEWHTIAAYEYAHHIGLKPGAGEFVRFLKQRGVKLSLATASGRELYEPVLKKNGIYGYFDAFTTLEEVSRGKEEPDIYLLAAEKIGVEPVNCVVFEDILCAVKSAKTAGMTVVAVCNPEELVDENPVAQAADECICDFRELIC